MKIIITISILLIIAQQSFAQHALIIRKRNFSKQYVKGDLIKIKTKDNKIIKGKIDYLFYDSLEIAGNILKFTEIKKLYVTKERFNFAGNGVQLIIAGVAFPTLIVINSLINGDPQLLPERYMVISPAIMLVGASLIYLGTKRIYLRGPARLTVI